MERPKQKTVKKTPKITAAKTKPRVSTKAAVVKTEKPKASPSAVVQALGLHNLKSPSGSHKPRKILGRGPGSGHGKTSTRGSKGQTSRAGRHFYLGFEGGQSPLIRRFPKRGFTSIFKKEFQIVNLDDLKRITDTTITPEVLQKTGLIKNKAKAVKILGNGEVKNAVTIQAQAFSKKAQDKITAAGGKAEVI